MSYILIGAAVLWLVLWASGRGRVFRRREWRITSAGFALAAFVAASAVGVRGQWQIAIVLLVVGLWLASSARRAPARPGEPRGGATRTPGAMSADEARSILGVGANATADEIQAAYTRLMRMAHPDKGGTSGLAAQLNAARDRLLRR